MTDINKLLNTTAAGLLAQKLDAKDGTKDDKISASIWNDFVKDKGGKEVKEFISVKDAMNSITTYLVREAKKAGESVDSLVKKWDNSVVVSENPTTPANPGASQTPANPTNPAAPSDPAEPPAAGTEPTAPTTPAAPAQPPAAGEIKTPEEVEAEKQAQIQADYKSVKVNIPNKPSQQQIKDIAKAQKEGKQLRNSVKAGKTDGITSKNIAYALGNTQFGPNSQKQAEIVFHALALRMSELGIFEDGKDYSSWSSVSKLPYDKQNSLMHKYQKRIIEKENEMVRLDKVEKVFDAGTKFMAEVANMDPKPEIKKDDNRTARAILPDGRWIQVDYDKNGEIEQIHINHDTTPDHKEDGTTSDYSDITFTKDKGYFNYNKSNFDYEGYITSGYNFEKLKALAEKIFGKAE